MRLGGDGIRHRRWRLPLPRRTNHSEQCQESPSGVGSSSIPQSRSEGRHAGGRCGKRQVECYAVCPTAVARLVRMQRARQFRVRCCVAEWQAVKQSSETAGMRSQSSPAGQCVAPRRDVVQEDRVRQGSFSTEGDRVLPWCRGGGAEEGLWGSPKSTPCHPASSRPHTQTRSHARTCSTLSSDPTAAAPPLESPASEEVVRGGMVERSWGRRGRPGQHTPAR